MRIAISLFQYFPYGGLQRDFIKLLTTCLENKIIVDVYTSDWQGQNDFPVNLKILKVRGKQNHVRVSSFVDECQKKIKEKTYDMHISFLKMPGADYYFCSDVCLADKLKSNLKRYLPRYKSYLNLEKAVFSSESKTKILSLSRKQKHLYQLTYQTQEERFCLLPPAIESKFFTRIEKDFAVKKIENQFKKSQSKFKYLFVASRFKTKGLDRVLRALATLSDEQQANACLFVVGHDEQKRYKRLQARLKLKTDVIYCGAQDDVQNFYQAADLLLHPARVELAGHVIMEALASGLPVITTENCGYAEHVLRCNGGAVISDYDQLEFETALSKALSHNLIEKWKDKGIEYVYTLQESSMTDCIIKNLWRDFDEARAQSLLETI